MMILSQLHYEYGMQELINRCIKHANTHPFNNHIFITDDPYMVEQRFFKQIPYLINIEVMTFHQWLRKLQNEYHLTQHRVVSQVELTYALRSILQTETFHCFSSEQIYPLIQQFIPLMKNYNLSMCEYHEEEIESLKLKDYIHLYHSLISFFDDDTHFNLESLFDSCEFQDHHEFVYIDARHLYMPKQIDLLNQLSQHYHITLYYPYHKDDRLMNLPYHHICQNAEEITYTSFITENLFSLKTKHSDQEMHYEYFFESSLQAEVKHVVASIYQKIVDEDLHYQDFIIVYPHSSYVQILIDTLATLQIPHSLANVKSCQYDYDYQHILDQIDCLQYHTFQEFANYFLSEEMEESYSQYFQMISSMEGTITHEEFKEFFIQTYQYHHSSISKKADQIQICSIHDMICDHPKHLYILGMNETVLPQIIKDTSLLLDEDIELLRSKGFQTPLTTRELLGVHYNDILCCLTQTMLSTTFSYSLQTLSGETLLVSSLLKQLQTMFNMKKSLPPQYQFIDDFYLYGGTKKEKTILNHHIDHYKSSKNQVSIIDEQTISQLYSPTLSVSQIETYNKCPFLYFIQYGLGIYPSYEEELLPHELGSLVHYILSKCIDQNKDISSLVDTYIKQDASLSKKVNASTIHQYFIQQLKEDLKITITVLKRQLSISQFQIRDKEKKIQMNIHDMNFKGFVDRIDEFENYIAIIDYKSSQKDIDITLAKQGFNIQMLWYLKMVTELEHKDPGAVLYFNTKKRILASQESLYEPVNEDEFYKQYRFGGYVIDDDTHQTILGLDPLFERKSDIIRVNYVKTRNEYTGHILKKDELYQLFDDIEEHIYQLYLEMIHGHIEIAPKGSDQKNIHTLVNPCHYCPYHSVCSFDVFYNDYVLVKTNDGGEEDAI